MVLIKIALILAVVGVENLAGSGSSSAFYVFISNSWYSPSNGGGVLSGTRCLLVWRLERSRKLGASELPSAGPTAFLIQTQFGNSVSGIFSLT